MSRTARAAKMQNFLLRCVQNRDKIEYASANEGPRPVKEYGIPPEQGFKQDCSGLTSLAYYWAGAPDPNKLFPGYRGDAYTGYQVNNDRVRTGRYRIGDLALYGSSRNATTHVTICWLPGTAASSAWVSLGEDKDPNSKKLNYRGDLLFVVRPGLK